MTESCPECGGALTETSDWSADDPSRGWQRITRFMCRGCGAVAVETVAREDVEVRSA